ncbi:MAG TPA: flagellar basal body rod protein FlgB [Nitrospirota bacterium]|nr:flagellar basal body rod protein FlgB [Nitrospirota bacterium]
MPDVMNLLERLLHQTAVRHRVLASNIANVDTPNYRAKDIVFSGVLGEEMRIAATDPKHIQPAASSSGNGSVTNEESQLWADKNNVELDQEVAKMTQNAMLFEAGVTLLKRRIQMFKNALKTS